MKKKISIILVGVFSLVSMVLASASSETGHYKKLGDVSGSIGNFFNQPTLPDGVMNGSVAKRTVTASGKSNQFANALAYLEYDGKVKNIMLLDGAQIVLNSKNKPSWLYIRDCEDGVSYRRINIYKLGPSIPCSVSVVEEPTKIVKIEKKAPIETVSVKVVQPASPEVNVESHDEGSMTVYTRGRHVTYMTGQSPFHNVVLLEDKSQIKVGKGKNERVLDYSIPPYQTSK